MKSIEEFTKELKKFSIENKIKSAIADTITTALNELEETTPIVTGQLKGGYFLVGSTTENYKDLTQQVPISMVEHFEDGNKNYYELEIVNYTKATYLVSKYKARYGDYRGEYIAPIVEEEHHYFTNMINNAEVNLMNNLSKMLKK